MYKVIIDEITNQIACIVRESDNAAIPLDERNVDYQAYLKWLEENNGL